MFFFREIWRSLFPFYLRYEICPFVLLSAICSLRNTLLSSQASSSFIWLLRFLIVDLILCPFRCPLMNIFEGII